MSCLEAQSEVEVRMPPLEMASIEEMLAARRAVDHRRLGYDYDC